MKLAYLFWRLLRYRVAVMLILFMLLGASLHTDLAAFAWKLVLGAFALSTSYVSATSVNDLADVKIDAINHPDSPGRPLVNGKAGRRDMWLIFGTASSLTLVLGVVISLKASSLMALSLVVNAAYSLSPIRLSYRTFVAPLLLGVAYVWIPYTLGVSIVGSGPKSIDWVWLAGLYLMFIGRIILKDFRDRLGDARYHKPTFLLRFGKRATCQASFAGILSGGLVIVWLTRQTIWLSFLVALYLTAILFMLKRLYASTEGRPEQLSIGVGAKMGNGLLITLLAVFALKQANALVSVQITTAVLLSSLFFANYINFLRHPETSIIGYKG